MVLSTRIMPLANRTRTYMYLTRQLHVSHCTRTPNEICFPPDHLTTLPPTLLPAEVTQSHNIEHFSAPCLNTLKNDKSSFLQLRPKGTLHPQLSRVKSPARPRTSHRMRSVRTSLLQASEKCTYGHVDGMHIKSLIVPNTSFKSIVFD